MAAPTIAGTPTTAGQDSASSSLVVSTPTGLQDDDYLVAAVRSQGDVATDASCSGWSRIGVPFAAGTGGRVTGFFGRPITDAGTEPSSHTFSFPSTSRSVISIFIVRGVDLTDPVSGNPPATTLGYRGDSDGSNGRSTLAFTIENPSLVLQIAGNECTSGNSHVPIVTPVNYLQVVNEQTGSGTSGSRTAIWVGSSVIADTTTQDAKTIWQSTAGDASQGLGLRGLPQSVEPVRFYFDETDGTTLATSNIVSTPSGYNATVVSPGPSSTFTYSNDIVPVTPGLSTTMKATIGASDSSVVRLPFATQSSSVALEFYHYMGSLPSATYAFVSIRHSGGIILRLLLGADGTIALQSGSGSTFATTATNVWKAGQWNRIAVVVDTISASSSYSLSVYQANNTISTDSINGTGINLGTNQAVTIDLGTPNIAPAGGVTQYFSAVQLRESGGSEIGVAPVIGSGPSITVGTALISSFGTDYLRGGWTLSGGSDFRMVISTNVSLSSPSYSTSAAVPTSNWVTARVSGLTPNTQYYIGIEVDGTLLTDGRLSAKTLTTDPLSYVALTSSCQQTGSNAIVFDQMESEGAAFFAHQGDLHYEDTTVEATWRNAFISSTTSARTKNFYASTPMTYVYDNHDWAGQGFEADDWNLTTNPATMVREISGEYGATTTNELSKTWVHGRVRYIRLDLWSTRDDDAATNGPTKRFITDEQEQWFYNTLEGATEPVIIFFSGWPLYRNVGNGRWASYPDQTARMKAWLEARPEILGRMVGIGGDSHAINADSGANQDALGEMPTLNVSPLDQSGGLPGGTWDIGKLDVDNSKGYYSKITITDTGTDEVDFKWDAVQDDGTVMMTYSKTFDAGPTPTATYGFEEGTDAAAITTSSPGVTLTIGAPVYSSALVQSDHGSLVASMPATSASPMLRYNPPNTTNFTVSQYVYINTKGSSAAYPFRIENGTTLLAAFRFHPDDTFDLADSTSNRVTNSTITYAIGEWYRIDTQVTVTGSDMLMSSSIFTPSESTVAAETISYTFTNASVIDNLKFTPGQSSWALTFDTIRLYDSVVTPTPYGTPVSGAGSVLHSWVGAPTQTAFQVVSKLSGTTSARLAVSTSAGMASPTYVAAETPDSDGYVRFDATGLTSGTQYYYQLECDSTLTGDIGKSKTLKAAGTAQDFTVAVGSCILKNKNDGVAVDSLRNWNPDLFLHLGDFYYTSLQSTDPGVYEGLYSDLIGTYPGLSQLMREIPSYYAVSDHEAGADNGDSDNAWVAAHIQTYKQVVPHRIVDTAPAPRGRWQSWVVGRVRFIMLDIRHLDRSPGLATDDASKTMLGATQKAWFKNQLLESELLKVVISDVGWMGPASLADGEDKWWAYSTERQEIIDFITTNNVNVDLWHGDSHSIAVAGKATNSYGGFPVICASPLAQVGGGRYLGEFDSVYNNSGGEARQYMRISFTDDGTTLTRSASGWDAAAGVERVASTETWGTPPSSGVLSDYIRAVDAVGSSSNSSSISITMPAAAQVGDVAVVDGNIGAGAGVTMTGPAGYTQAVYQANGFNTTQLGLYYKTLALGDLGSTITLTASAGRTLNLSVIVLKDVTYDTVSSISEADAATTATLPSVTPTEANSVAVSFVNASVLSAASITSSSGWTEQSEVYETGGSSPNVNYITAQLLSGGAGVPSSAGTATLASDTMSYLSATMAFTPVVSGPSVISLVDQADADTYGTSLTLNYTSTAGNTLVLYGNSAGSNTVTDTAGNTWTFAEDTVPDGATAQRQGQLYYCVNAAAITSVTLTAASNSNYNFKITEWANVAEIRDTNSNLLNVNPAPVFARQGDVYLSSVFHYEASGLGMSTPQDFTGLAVANRSDIVTSSAYRTVTDEGMKATNWTGGSNGVINISMMPVGGAPGGIELFKWNGDNVEPLPSNTGGLTIVNDGIRPPAYQADNSSGTQSVGYWDTGTQTTCAARVYFKTPTSWGGSNTKILSFVDTATFAVRASFAVSGSLDPGGVRFTKDGGANSDRYYDVIELDTWYRLEMLLDQDNGRVRAYLYEGDSAVEVLNTGWVSDTFGSFYDRVYVGIAKDTADEGLWLFDDIKGITGLTLIGPAQKPYTGLAPSRTNWVGGSNQPGSYFENNNFAKPVTASVGDWMILTLTHTGDTTVTDADGWTLIAERYTTGTLRSTVYAKTVQPDEFNWAFVQSNTSAVTYSLMWGIGAAPVSEWGYGVWLERTRTGTSSTNVANPGIATFTDNSLVLTVSTERTSALEPTGITSMTGATPWFFQGHTAGMIETHSVGYAQVASPGVTPNVTVTYPNTVTSNGNIIQFALPPDGYTQTTIGAVRAVASTNTGAASATSLSLAIPAAAKACDTAVVIGNYATGSGAVLTGPVGYTQLANQASGFNNSFLGVWYKHLKTADLGTSPTMTGDLNRRMGMAVVVVQGASYNAVSSIIDDGSPKGTASTPSVTPTTDNAFLLSITNAAAAEIVSGADQPLHWNEELTDIAVTPGSTELMTYISSKHVKAGASIPTYEYRGLTIYSGGTANSLTVTVAFTESESNGTTVTVWDGTTRLPATIIGIWDGSNIIPAKISCDQPLLTGIRDPDVGSATLSWSAGFNGTTLDSSVWTAVNVAAGTTNNELQAYTDRASNVYVQDDILHLVGRQESFNGAAYTSGKISTIDKRLFQYGYIVTRMRIPKGQGLWPAFWTLGRRDGDRYWPTSGEIDIFESVNDMDFYGGAVHGGEDNEPPQAGDHWSLSRSLTGLTLSDGAFHLFAINWRAGLIEFFYDNVFIGDISASDTPAGKDWPFDRVPHYLMLNLAIGGDWPGSPDGSTSFPATVEVDWVRVYNEGTGIPVTTQSPPPVPVPKLNTLTDDFSGTIANWPNAFNSPSVSGGRGVIPIDSGVYSGFDTGPAYDFANSQVHMEWNEIPALSPSRETLFQLVVDADSTNYIMMFRSGSNTSVTGRVRKAGVDTQQSFTTSDQWWRMRESAGTAYFDTSADGSIWTTRYQVAHGLSVAQLAGMRLVISSGDYGSLGPATTYVDNVNV